MKGLTAASCLHIQRGETLLDFKQCVFGVFEPMWAFSCKLLFYCSRNKTKQSFPDAFFVLLIAYVWRNLQLCFFLTEFGNLQPKAAFCFWNMTQRMDRWQERFTYNITFPQTNVQPSFIFVFFWKCILYWSYRSHLGGGWGLVFLISQWSNLWQSSATFEREGESLKGNEIN